jgi:hypothetical protein
MVLMEYTRRNAVGPDGARANMLLNVAAFPAAGVGNVIRPNADTLYSSAWIDLSKEPVMLHVPDTHGRYYLMQFMDAWTETFSVPGKRTTGTDEGWFAIVGPGWSGRLPAGARRGGRAGLARLGSTGRTMRRVRRWRGAGWGRIHRRTRFI